MPVVSEKKRKLLLLWKILLEKTDESHPMTLPQLLEELEAMGIVAERKSIYDDIETLRSVGVKVEKRKSRMFAYFIEERQFTLRELKCLADAVQTSPVVSKKNAEELVSKLCGLCSAYQKEEVFRPVEALGPFQPGGEKLSRKLDVLHRAMRENRRICFQPVEWRVSQEGKPERVVRRGGRAIAASPWKLLWDGSRYWVLLYSSASGKAEYYQVDRIAAVELLPQLREGGEEVKALEAERGQEKLTLEFSSRLLGEVAEHFGPDIWIEPSGKNKLRAVLRDKADQRLFTWLYSMGPDVRLLAPKKAAEQFRERAKALAKLYKN